MWNVEHCLAVQISCESEVERRSQRGVCRSQASRSDERACNLRRLERDLQPFAEATHERMVRNKTIMKADAADFVSANAMRFELRKVGIDRGGQLPLVQKK